MISTIVVIVLVLLCVSGLMDAARTQVSMPELTAAEKSARICDNNDEEFLERAEVDGALLVRESGLAVFHDGSVLSKDGAVSLANEAKMALFALWKAGRLTKVASSEFLTEKCKAGTIVGVDIVMFGDQSEIVFDGAINYWVEYTK
jgi:hypothetical protein